MEISSCCCSLLPPWRASLSQIPSPTGSSPINPIPVPLIRWRPPPLPLHVILLLLIPIPSHPSPKSLCLLKFAVVEADAAISFNPHDAAPHILRSLALRHLGHHIIGVVSGEPHLRGLHLFHVATHQDDPDRLRFRGELHG